MTKKLDGAPREEISYPIGVRDLLLEEAIRLARSARGRLAAALPVVAIATLLAGAADVSAGSAPGTVTTGCSLTMRCQGDIGWPSTEGPVTGGRYSPLAQINVHNVRHLAKAFAFTTKVVGSENYPVVIGDTAYVTTQFGNVFAFNATTGSQLWSYSPTPTGALATHGYANRGVAVGDGNVYVLNGASDLVALNAATGTVKWSVATVPDAVKRGYYESTAPLFYDGVVYVGSSGGDSGVRGYEAAFSAKTGAMLWRFWTVPASGTGWTSAPGNHGGGAVWMVPTLDPSLGLMFISVGNPSPDFYANDRLGLNHWTDSVVALRLTTGKFVWGYDETPHDMWDYDTVAPVTLFPAQGLPALGSGNKGGIWYELDAKTGALITQPQAFVYQNHSTPPTSGPKAIEWPGYNDGAEWSAAAYDPQTGLAYEEGISGPSLEKAYPAVVAHHKVGQVDVATSFFPPPKNAKVTGTLTAFSADNGTVVWQKTEPVGLLGGATATAGGVLFVQISGDSMIEALNARTGKVLWRARVSGPVDSGMSVYSVGGKEYLMVPVGGSGLTAHNTYGGPDHATNATFVVYTLK